MASSTSSATKPSSSKSSPPVLPWLARLVNVIGRLIRRFFPVLRFDPAYLMIKAQRKIGLHDFAPDATFHEGLALLCDSIEQDVQPTFLGRFFLREIIVRVLCNRLLLVHWRAAKPERFAQTLRPPLIVVGMPRSGTTFLHRLLALEPTARALTMWELQRPLPPLGADHRRLEGRIAIRLIRWAAVDLDAKHLTSGDAIEECMLLLDTSMVSLSHWVFAPVYRYLHWWMARDKTEPYQRYREHLVWLQGETPAARLTLKAPAHTPCLDALLAAIPDAMIVQTQRDPGVVVPSLHSLLSTIHRTMTDTCDPVRMAETNTQLLLQMVSFSKAVRNQIAPGKVFDVEYNELIHDPIAMVQKIYHHFGLHFSAEYEARLRTALAADRHHEFGGHRYRAEDFGQTSDEIRRRFTNLNAVNTIEDENENRSSRG